jgi:hypothetical protein
MSWTRPITLVVALLGATRRRWFILGALMLGAAVGGGYAFAQATAATTDVINACEAGANGALRVSDTCRTNEVPTSWNQIDPPGPPGPPGSVRAWAFISSSGNVLYGKNVSGVHDFTQGTYCVILAPSIDPGQTAPVVSVAGGSSEGPRVATVVPAGCTAAGTVGDQVQIWQFPTTGEAVGAPAFFSIVIP